TRRVAAIRAHHEAREFRRAAAETRALWARANAYVQEAAPWSAIRHDRLRAAVVTRVALGLVELCATVAWSIVPSLAASAIVAVGGTEAEVPGWPGDVEDVLIGDRSRARVPRPFAPVAKVDAESVGAACR
ncbi:methionine--tRNA ligase, partial [Methylobacterium tarhaniae]